MLLVLVLVVIAIIKVFPDWQDRVGLNRREDSAEETLRQRYERSLEVLRNGRASEKSGANSGSATTGSADLPQVAQILL